MTIKDFKRTQLFKNANIVEYLDLSGNEIELPRTSVQDRRFDRKEISSSTTRVENGLKIVTLYIQ